MQEHSILFVCTGNIFRSLSAEYCLKKYLTDNGIGGWNVGSAGTVATTQPIHPVTRDTLEALRVSGFESHVQRKVTETILKEYRTVVGMAQDHIDFLREQFGCEAVLFDELAGVGATSIWDVEDDVPDYATNTAGVEKKVADTVRRIFEETPGVYKNTAIK